MRAMRAEHLTAEFARRLHQHCVEEMGYLAEMLPVSIAASRSTTHSEAGRDKRRT